MRSAQGGCARRRLRAQAMCMKRGALAVRFGRATRYEKWSPTRAAHPSCTASHRLARARRPCTAASYRSHSRCTRAQSRPLEAPPLVARRLSEGAPVGEYRASGEDARRTGRLATARMCRLRARPRAAWMHVCGWGLRARAARALAAEHVSDGVAAGWAGESWWATKHTPCCHSSPPGRQAAACLAARLRWCLTAAARSQQAWLASPPAETTCAGRGAVSRLGVSEACARQGASGALRTRVCASLAEPSVKNCGRAGGHQ